MTISVDKPDRTAIIPCNIGELFLGGPTPDAVYKGRATSVERYLSGNVVYYGASSLPVFPGTPSLAARPAEERLPRSEWAARIHDFRDYVNRLADDRDGGRSIGPDVARTALKLWWKCFGSFDGSLAIPDVAAGEAGELLFIWKHSHHYLSVEMTADGPAEVFYRNQKTGAIWGRDLNLSDREIPGPILGRLAYFVAGE